MEEDKAQLERIDLSAEITAFYAPIYSYLMLSHAEAWRGLRLTMSQFKILAAISSSSVIDSPTLLKHLGILPSALTRTVDNLVRQGLVLRSERPPDRRIVYLSCTDKGTGLIRSLTDHASARSLTGALDRMRIEDLHALRDGLAALGKAIAAPNEAGGTVTALAVHYPGEVVG